ncbi:Na+/H+ antiporter subunit E [Pararhizobium sp. O133]|uniref:Na+/H+ antiporter subunit E n=1 Tax=Pararhizobium sp. O133 TaxID=3449278 RepID=UPI003F682EB4
MSAHQGKMRKHVLELPRGLVFLWIFLFAVWLVINASMELPVVASGALVSLVLSWIFLRRSNVWRIEMTPRRALHFLAYTGVFFTEMVKANIEMLRYVYAPRIDIRPGIVKINVRLTSPIGRLALANSIALTPGSLVLDITDNAMFIHWLDVKTTDPEKASEMIAGAFEKHLGAAFG